MDEAAFGRISDPARCWAPAGIRPEVPSQTVREYIQLYGAVDPKNGDDFYLIMPKCNTEYTNIYLEGLSKQFADDYILLCTDNASRHTSKSMLIPDNIRLFYLPARTPEMNPAEQIWKEIRKIGFKNKLFNSITEVVAKLSDVIKSLSSDTVKSITGRDWILSIF
jgi:putative transposase